MIILAGIVFTLSAIGTALAPTVGWLIGAMVASGIGIGIASFISPMYIAELAPAKVRGSLVAVNMLAITTGIVVAYLVDYAFSASHGWRYMFGLAVVPSIGLVIGMWWLPDSPRWLISKSKIDQARQVLRRARTTSDVGQEIKDIQQSMAEQGEGGMAGLFQPSLRMPMIVGLGLATFQQITGINTVIYYAPTIFKFAGISAAGPAILAGAGLAAVMWCFHVLAIFLLDRIGRRPLLLTGVAGQIVGLGDPGRGVPVSAAGELQERRGHRRPGDLRGLLRLRARADLLAPDLRDLSPEEPRRRHERRHRNQLGHESAGGRDFPNPGRGPGACRHVLAVRPRRDRRLDFLLSAGPGNEGEKPGADRSALALRENSTTTLKARGRIA